MLLIRGLTMNPKHIKAQPALLSFKDLSLSFGTNQALNMLSYDIYHNEIVGLVGESGSGKTLSALAAMQLLPMNALVSPHSRIIYHGNDLLTYTERQMRDIRGRDFAMIFQDAMTAFNPVFTIGNQIVEAIYSHRRCRKKIAKEEAIKLLDDVGIKEPLHCFKAYPHQLSGGMLQRAMIAMALSSQPQLLIADEPTTALDVTIQAQVITLLKTIKHRRAQTAQPMSILFISHDLGLVSQLCDRIIVLKEGVKVEENTAQQFFKMPQHTYSQKLMAALPRLTPQQISSQPSEQILNTEKLAIYFPIRRGALRLKQGDIKAVDQINLTIPLGETLALVGESGSGKTTTARALLKLINITSGAIYFEQQSITKLTQRQFRPYRRDIQIIFQDPYAALNPRRLVGDSIAEGFTTQKLIASKHDINQRVDELLLKVGLSPEMKNRYPHEFSGGQKQRICIARALGLQPKLLILDEPTSALDVSIQAQILKLLLELQHDHGLSYLLITHNLGVVAEIAHHMAVMKQGRIVEQGLTTDVLTNPQHSYTQQLLAACPQL